MTFDTVDRLTDISHVLGGVTTVSSFGYGHNAVNQRTSLTQTRPSVTVTAALSYGYDDLDRLTQATNPEVAAPDETFGYDPVGNRLNRDGQVVDSVFDAANRLIEDDDFTYAYDLNGNLETKTAKVGGAVTSYDWDAENRLTRIDLPGGGFAEYRYDGLDRRIEKNANGALTRYVYDGADILLEYDGLNVLLARYTHGPGTDDVVMLEHDLDASGTFDASERFFVHVDGLGSVTEVTDQNGSVIDTFVYDSYGRFVQRPATPVSDLFTFTSRQFDEESGLYYYRARYYDPETGTFTQQDPVGFAAGDENLYRYTMNNPINLVDPDGLSSAPTGFSVKSSSAAQPLPPIDQLQPVKVSPDFIALIVAQCQTPKTVSGKKGGRPSLQSKLARSNNRFTAAFGLVSFSNPTQEQVNMVATGILTSPNLQISRKKPNPGGLLPEGGFMLRMNGSKSPGIALDTQLNFEGFMN